jgi:hypothetical protein
VIGVTSRAPGLGVVLEAAPAGMAGASEASKRQEEESMSPSSRPWLRVRAARGAATAHGASMLRLSARPAAGGAPAWLAGLTRVLRSAGPAREAQPWLGVLAGGDFAPGEKRAGR